MIILPFAHSGHLATVATPRYEALGEAAEKGRGRCRPTRRGRAHEGTERNDRGEQGGMMTK